METLSRVLTSRGYAVRKSSLTKEEEQLIRKELTVSPQSLVASSRFASAAKPFAVYYESQERFYLPRHWARNHLGPEEGMTVPEGIDLPSDVTFTGKPFDYQVQVIQQFLDAGANGLICVPCGRGKTFMSLAIAARIRKRFLVIVDKEFLLNQWKGEIQTFFPGLRIGVLRGDKRQVGQDVIVGKPLTVTELKEKAKEAGLRVTGTREDILKRLIDAGISCTPTKQVIEYDCTLCMIQTLVAQDFPSGFFKDYGFAIFDECHHLGAEHFSRALLKIQTKNMLGLSATPTRDDGLTKVFEWYIGTPVYWEKIREPDTSVIVRAMFYDTDDIVYKNEPKDYRGDIITATLMAQILDYAPRTEWIGATLCELTSDPKRRILVLSQYKRHLKAFETILTRDCPAVTWSYYIGGMKEAFREEGAKRSQVILGSYSMASEAMNIKTLNTVILVSPRKKIEQSVGRIFRQRKEEREVDPLIIDIIDSHGMYRRQFIKRKQFYDQCKYKIERLYLKKDIGESDESDMSDDSDGSDDLEDSDIDESKKSTNEGAMQKKKAVPNQKAVPKTKTKKALEFDFVDD